MNPNRHATRADGCVATVLWLVVLGAIIVGLISVVYATVAARLDSVMLPALTVCALGLVWAWQPSKGRRRR